MTIDTRIATTRLEIRDDGRTIVGVLVPYGTETRIGSYTETFERGAFADADPQRVPLLAAHNRTDLPIGRAVTLTEHDDGLHAELHVSETRHGDDVLALVRDGAATGLSVGFIPVIDRWSPDRSRVTRLRAELVEASIVGFPAYNDARIAAVRHQSIATPRLTIARLR
jgi:HK97 family phage prohead protease